MRVSRLKLPNDRPSAFYHCVSRIADKRPIFGPEEKDHFVSLVRECERFCRVRVLTFAVMHDHFHILLEVPQRPDPLSLPSPLQILADLKLLSGHQFPVTVRQRFDALSANPADKPALDAYLASFHARMFDVSAFMKLLKQRFTQWFNSRNSRKGTLWEERFRSVLVDGAGEALLTMAAYIDLNPVRAGIVQDPKDYQWSGYGEAMAASKRARLGIQRLATALQHGHEESPARSLELYREFLHLDGDERRQDIGPDGKPVRGSIGAEEAAKVLAAKGRLPSHDYVRCRVRYFSDGAVFGTRDFVDEVFRANRERYGAKRTTGARKMKGLEGSPFFVLRDLQLNLFG